MKVKIPVSVGELYDKISILEHKSKHIKDPHKLLNVEKEHRMLCRIAVKIDPDFDGDADYLRLAKINRSLWDIEEGKRDCERRKDFGEEFIRLARLVYKKNDERAKVKRSINEKKGSDIVEEKSYKKY